MYDIIGDVHGHAPALEALLSRLGYTRRNGCWQHPERTALFTGDYIDRGPAIRETLYLIRQMVEGGKGLALMGNHEYNALAYDFEVPGGTHLRRHNEKHRQQHAATLQQFADHLGDWRSYLDWFRTLPLFADLPGLRAVHACWDESHVGWLKGRGHATLSEALLIGSHEKGTMEHEVINELLKGKELSLAPEHAFADKDGHYRTRARIKWWMEAPGACYGNFLFNCHDELREKPVEGLAAFAGYPADAPPVFFGHYWLSGPSPLLQAPNVACLDYSIAKGGQLVAYRWYGEQQLDCRNFVQVA
ncbi:metallophosphoesterase [Paraflavisolibacter sp. H34]|uniref:metallophosphoesterase n=1 Tax=Huijunlia imazamoxiresistens TaxID=3127457 RepID=UPI003016A24F